MANKKVKKTENHSDKKEKKLDGIQTMHKFIEELKAVKDGDYSKVIALTQITWRKNAVGPNTTLALTAQKVGKENVGVRLKKVLSDNCLIVELRTNTGIYSTKVICETKAYKPDPKGEWGVNPLSFHKM